MKARLRIVLLVSMSAACTHSSRVVKVYEDASFAGVPFATILVVGVHDDRSIRRRFEDSVARALGEHGTEAVSSITVMGADEAFDAEWLTAAARATAADGVLITRLLDVQTSSEIQGGRVSTETVRRNHDGTLADFFLYDYLEYEDPMTITTVRTVITASDLYNTVDGTKVWSVESTAFEKESAEELIATISGSIARRLERDGLVR